MNKTQLAKVTREYASVVKEQADEIVDSAPSAYSDMLDAYELLLVLARIFEGRALHKCFGAVGDWGYESKVGKALISKPE